LKDFILRDYSAPDHDAVMYLHRHVLELEGAYLGEGINDNDLEDIERVYLCKGAFLIGECDGNVIAMGALRPLDSGLAEIKRMRVLPKYQRQGIGSQILRELERRAGEMGFRRLVLDTSTLQYSAQELYRKFGYDETHRGNVGDLELIYMEKYLQ
jgi:ribosomal protein S18 acetylase RimI-like enzyme